MTDAVGWLLRQCVEAAIAAAILREMPLPKGCQVGAITVFATGEVFLTWSRP